MAVVKCIESDGYRLKLFINAHGRIAIMIYDETDMMSGLVMELDHDDVRELIRQCKAIIKKD